MPTGNTLRSASDEVDTNQLEMAREEGEAYRRSLVYMAMEVADAGGEQHAGDYVVAFAQERAEGMYMLCGEGDLEWIKPQRENCHLEISVRDAVDGRFVPYLQIEAVLTSADGAVVGPFVVPFVWHPGLFHYGLNIELPGDGHYTIGVRIFPPAFMRHDKKYGQRYAKTVEVEFKDVLIKTGRE